jgi:hypothetical protein
MSAEAFARILRLPLSMSPFSKYSNTLVCGFHEEIPSSAHPKSAQMYILSLRPNPLLVQKPTLVNLKLLFRHSVQKPPKLLFLSGF